MILWALAAISGAFALGVIVGIVIGREADAELGQLTPMPWTSPWQDALDAVRMCAPYVEPPASHVFLIPNGWEYNGMSIDVLGYSDPPEFYDWSVNGECVNA